MISVNEMALDIVEDMVDYEEELRVESSRLKNGATVIDCGINVLGGYEAGIMFTRACMGGYCEVEISMNYVNDKFLPFVTQYTDQPAVSCLGSQKAGWQIKVGDYFAMGSGPARALALKPKKTYEQIEYEDDADYAVIALESNKLPGEEVIDYIAKECEIGAERVYALVAPTASIAGSVQISGRIIETALFRLAELGYNPRSVISASGVCPIAPVMGDDLKAMGSTNDSMIYFGSVTLTVSEYSDSFNKIASKESKDYGKPFLETFSNANYDFYSIDASLFAPAQAVINDISEGKTYVFGELNPDVLLKSYQIE